MVLNHGQAANNSTFSLKTLDLPPYFLVEKSVYFEAMPRLYLKTYSHLSLELPTFLSSRVSTCVQSLLCI